MQSDHFHPGRLPTRFWTPDKYVADHHAIPIPTWTPPGVYDIVVGIYRRNGERLPLIVDYQPLTPLGTFGILPEKGIDQRPFLASYGPARLR
ncbi:MAG: hypothetical protein ACUVX1_17970 [Chloroflexota bacterium]